MTTPAENGHQPLVSPAKKAAQFHAAADLLREGKADQALSICLGLFKLFPEDCAILNLTGSALLAKGLLKEAEDVLRAALELSPHTEEITLNLTRVLEKAGKADEAVAALENGLLFVPTSPRILSTLGKIHYFNSRFDLAETAFEQALVHEPNTPETLFRLACTYQERHQFKAAFDTYLQLLDIKPDHAEACVNLSQLLQSLGERDEAEALLRRAAALAPDNAVYSSMCIFRMNYGDHTGETYLKEAKAWAARYSSRNPPEQQFSASKDGRIRLGFVSGDFCLHPVGRLFHPILSLMDCETFDIHCFSNVQIEDELTHAFRQTAEHFHNIRDLDDDQARELIRANNIDVLVDLSGHSRHNRLAMFGARVAPVQVMWLGYFNTTGLDAMDYILADRVNLPPNAEQHYMERPLRLPDSFFPYSMPSGLDIPRREPQETITFGCFNDTGKLNDEVFATWAAIMEQVPNSRLLLKGKVFSDGWATRRILERAASQGVPPGRVQVEGPSGYHDYLRAHARVDLCLDPFPYSGGATTADALFTGTPVLTYPGQSFGSRLSASILTAVGMEELICADLDAYIEKAVTLANDRGHLEATRERLIETFATSRFCDVPGFTRDLKAALKQAYKKI